MIPFLLGALAFFSNQKKAPPHPDYNALRGKIADALKVPGGPMAIKGAQLLLEKLNAGTMDRGPGSKAMQTAQLIMQVPQTGVYDEATRARGASLLGRPFPPPGGGGINLANLRAVPTPPPGRAPAPRAHQGPAPVMRAPVPGPAPQVAPDLRARAMNALQQGVQQGLQNFAPRPPAPQQKVQRKPQDKRMPWQMGKVKPPAPSPAPAPAPDPPAPAPPRPAPKQLSDKEKAINSANALYRYVTEMETDPRKWGHRGSPNRAVLFAQTHMGQLVADGIYGPATRARGKVLTGKTFPVRA